MKKYIILGTIICSYLAFPAIGSAQKRTLSPQKAILITPAKIIAEPAMVPDKPGKVTVVFGTPDGQTAVAPPLGVLLANPAKSPTLTTPVTLARPVTPVPTTKPAIELKVKPALVK